VTAPLAASLLEDLFVPQVSLLEKMLRAFLVFAFLVVALRLGGKRELGQINVLDLAVLLLASNALQNAMIGDDDTLVGGMIGASALFLANYFFVRLTYRSRRARDLLEGRPTPLFADGRVLENNLRRQAIRRSELLTIIRERGFADFGDVDGIVLEPNGHIVITRRAEA
jgi:uncharacterized membrane protein YcaP (DUF421 family)